MKWIEQIRVRSTPETLKKAVPQFVQQLEMIERGTDEVESFVMQHALYEGDLAIVLVWRNGSPPQKTREGFMLAEQLKQLGAIDHAVWRSAENLLNKIKQ